MSTLGSSRRPPLARCLPPVGAQLPPTVHGGGSLAVTLAGMGLLPSHPPRPTLLPVISNGLHYGYWVGFDYCHICRESPYNLSSARDQPQVIQDYLARECSAEHVLGPLDPLTQPQVHVNRFGVIPRVTQANGASSWTCPCQRGTA